jgi:hypothetical protein
MLNSIGEFRFRKVRWHTNGEDAYRDRGQLQCAFFCQSGFQSFKQQEVLG